MPELTRPATALVTFDDLTGSRFCSATGCERPATRVTYGYRPSAHFTCPAHVPVLTEEA